MYEAILLAGGLGTRLRSMVQDVPKVMAPVAGKPFLHYCIEKLRHEGITRIIVSVGYKYEIIQTFLNEMNYPCDIVLSIEETPLGTGGGIRLGMSQTVTDDVFILNGDSFFDCSLMALHRHHSNSHADVSLALKPMQHFDRYGTVTLEGNRIIAFNEKQYRENGLINAGVYIVNKRVFENLSFPETFSLEKELFEKHTHDLMIMGYVFDGYFIDIGIPEDYKKADTDFALKNK